MIAWVVACVAAAVVGAGFLVFAAVKRSRTNLANVRTLAERQQFDRLMRELDALGFYRWADPARAEALRRASLDQRLPFQDGDFRLHETSRARLASAGVASMIRKMEPVLRSEGVESLDVTDETTSGETTTGEQPSDAPATADAAGAEYRVIVSGHEVPVWDAQMPAPQRRARALQATVDILSWLLASAGSEERAYGFTTTRDGRTRDAILLLTPAMHAAIVQSGLVRGLWEEAPVIEDEGEPAPAPRTSISAAHDRRSRRERVRK